MNVFQARLLAEFKRLEESLKQFQEIQSQGIERKFILQGKQLQEKLHYKMMIQEAEMTLQMTKAEQDRERSEGLAMLYSDSPNHNSLAQEPAHPRWPTPSTPQATMTDVSTTDIPTSVAHSTFAPVPSAAAPATVAPVPSADTPSIVAPVTSAAAPSTVAPVPSAAAPSTVAPVPSAAAPSTVAQVPSAATPSTVAPVPSAAAPSTVAPVPSAATPSTVAPVPLAAAPSTLATENLSEEKMNLTEIVDYGDYNENKNVTGNKNS
jgi:hypothetical protein